jgi:hypothetical protein
MSSIFVSLPSVIPRTFVLFSPRRRPTAWPHASGSHRRLENCSPQTIRRCGLAPVNRITQLCARSSDHPSNERSTRTLGEGGRLAALRKHGCFAVIRSRRKASPARRLQDTGAPGDRAGGRVAPPCRIRTSASEADIRLASFEPVIGHWRQGSSIEPIALCACAGNSTDRGSRQDSP